MREARDPQGSTLSLGRAPVVRLETCAHSASILQPKNLTSAVVRNHGLHPDQLGGGRKMVELRTLL